MSLLQEALQKAKERTPASVISKAVEVEIKKTASPLPVVPAPQIRPIPKDNRWHTPPIITQIRREINTDAPVPAVRELPKQMVLATTSVIILIGILSILFLWRQGLPLSKPVVRAAREISRPMPALRMPSLVPELSYQPKLRLTGITVSGDEKLALINNQVVGVGDFLREKARVKEIRERSVILDFQGKDVRLTL